MANQSPFRKPKQASQSSLRYPSLYAACFVAGTLIGFMIGRGNDCSIMATATTSIAPSGQFVSGLEFLTMEPMPSADTASPQDSYAKARASNSLPMPGGGKAPAL